jgi:hypothetical protein
VESTRAWLVVAVAFLSNAVAFGITYSFGVMFDGLSAEFGAGRGVTATVFSFAMALHFLLGSLTGPASDRHGQTAGSFGCLIGPPVAGAVIDLTDGYSTAIVVSAVVVFSSWALLRPRAVGA